ncbi:hypothetical protein DFH08DRAFT_813611 [Mycena albidolilacea]|uniref:Uncharacterized protein n=1 Tax=Mycena albidolilacea TaxID=1033008 RepID=A0AAD6ZRX8_9AGAR|nr:hypothetical protein DFH08DRAFT_813611 [Mycena albidolilacea]
MSYLSFYFLQVLIWRRGNGSIPRFYWYSECRGFDSRGCHFESANFTAKNFQSKKFPRQFYGQNFLRQGSGVVKDQSWVWSSGVRRESESESEMKVKKLKLKVTRMDAERGPRMMYLAWHTFFTAPVSWVTSSVII